jgi:hypothetical protein
LLFFFFIIIVYEMPRLSKKAKATKNRKRDSRGRLVKSDKTTTNVPEVWEKDTQVLFVTVEEKKDSPELDVLNINKALLDNSSHTGKRVVYRNDSRTTKWRRKTQSKKVGLKQTLHNFGLATVPKPIQEKKKRKSFVSIEYTSPSH